MKCRIRKFIVNVLFLSILSTLLIFSFGMARDIQREPPSKDLIKEELNPKLQSILQEISIKRKKGLAEVKQLAERKSISLRDDRVEVIIEPINGQVSFIEVRELEKLGGKVLARTDKLMRSSIPSRNLQEVANEVNGIDFIRLPHRPRAMKVDASEGVKKTGADDFHSEEFYGQGARVAIIDLGFGQLTEAKSSGDLPAEYISYQKDYTGDEDIEWGGNHGTAVAEIVHDMAPKAKLYLMKIGDVLDLQKAKNEALEMDIDVINHSVGWYNTSYYDGTGVVSEIVSGAREGNILWVNSAGNEAKSHWKGGFVDTDGDRWHEFSGGDECNGFGTVSSGTRISIYMTWNAWPSDAENYDLYLLNGQGEITASSEGYQNGTQRPTEIIDHRVQSTGDYCFAVSNRAAPSVPEFEVLANTSSGNPNLQYQVEKSSIVDPANEEDALAVGAIYKDNWANGPQEAFSSLGPTNDSKYSQPRVKPDVMGPDGVSVSVKGAFYGTSASAPHVAGAAALLLSVNTGRSASELESILESEALDLGQIGKDNVYGEGKLNLIVGQTTHPIPYVVSRWVDGNLDPNADPTISINQVLQAISWWSNGTEVPNTGGKTIDINKVLKLISYWAEGKEITESTTATNTTTRAKEPKRHASTNTNYLKDLTHKLSTSKLQATKPLNLNLSFTPKEKINGLGLELNLPEGWALVPKEDDRPAYRPSKDQILWLDLKEGQPTRLTYRLLPPSSIEATTEYEIKGKLLSKSPNLEKQLPAKTITLTPPPALSLQDTTVHPNPVTTNQEVTFRAEGEGIVSTRLQVYNPSGEKLYRTNYRKGSTITWNLTDQKGNELTNGLYLYRIKARGKDGTTRTSEVKRFLILR